MTEGHNSNLAERTLAMSNDITNKVDTLKTLNTRACYFTRPEDRAKIGKRFNAVIKAYNRYGLAVSTSMQRAQEESRGNYVLYLGERPLYVLINDTKKSAYAVAKANDQLIHLSNMSAQLGEGLEIVITPNIPLEPTRVQEVSLEKALKLQEQLKGA